MDDLLSLLRARSKLVLLSRSLVFLSFSSIYVGSGKGRNVAHLLLAILVKVQQKVFGIPVRHRDRPSVLTVMAIRLVNRRSCRSSPAVSGDPPSASLN